jgi:transposase-like protein
MDAVLPGVTWQRWQSHIMHNALEHVPKMAMEAQDAADLRRDFDVDDPAEAQRPHQDVVVRYR